MHKKVKLDVLHVLHFLKSWHMAKDYWKTRSQWRTQVYQVSKKIKFLLLGRIRLVLTRWANSLVNMEEPLRDIVEDLSNGIQFCQLIEHLAGSKIKGINKNTKIPSGNRNYNR